MNVKTIYVEITNQCNLNCATCYNRSALNHSILELSFVQIKNIIEVFLPFGIKRFLFSGGEPTLHSEFERILDLIDEYPKITFGIVTNGTNHNKKLLEFLNTRNNLKLQISLDGSCEEINAKTRGTGNFDKTVKFAKKVQTPHITPLLKMVISQNNYFDIQDFCDLAFSLNFIPEFAFIYKSGNGSDEWEQKGLSAMQKICTLRLVEDIKKERKADIFLPICTTKCPLGENLENLSLCIRADGLIQPCQSLYSKEYSLGNVLSFNKKLFFHKLNHISVLAKRRYEQNFDCNQCILGKICGRGCMAEAINLHNDPMAKDGNCDYRKQEFVSTHLKKNISFK